MRKLIVANIVSLDGYYEGPGGNVTVLPMDHTFDAYNAERLAAAGTLLLGRKTYEMFKGFGRRWPTIQLRHPTTGRYRASRTLSRRSCLRQPHRRPDGAVARHNSDRPAARRP